MKAVPHIVWALVLVAMFLGFRLWLAQHDARLRAEDEVKMLEASIQKRDQDAAQQVQAIEKKAAKVKTSKQAVEAMPDVTSLPEPVRLLSDFNIQAPPKDIPHLKGAAVIPGPSVVPLYQNLANCSKQDIELKACKADEADHIKQIGDLQKLTKHGFWRRAESCGLRVAVGMLPGALAKNNGLVAAGGSVAVGTCFLFKF